MKKIIFLIITLTLSGCGTGLYFGPDASITVNNGLTVANYILVVVNSSPFTGEVFLNGYKIGRLDPWSQRAVSIESYHINWYNSSEITFTARFNTNKGIATFTLRRQINNYNNYSESWEITSRMIKNKMNYSQ